MFFMKILNIIHKLFEMNICINFRVQGNKNVIYKTKSFCILLALLMGCNIFCYLIKSKTKLKHSLLIDRTDFSEGIDVNKKSASKQRDICHCWFILSDSFKFQTNACYGCHDLLMMSLNLAILLFKH